MQHLGAISKNGRMISICFQGKPFSIRVIQVYASTTNAEQGEVGHFYEDLQALLVCLGTQSCLTLCDPMDCSPPGFLCPWDCPGKNTGMGYHAILQGIFLTHRSNLGLLHWQASSLPLSQQQSYLPSKLL